MLRKSYTGFIKSSAFSEVIAKQPTLSGEQAQEIYLREIKGASSCTNFATNSLCFARQTSSKRTNTTQGVKSLEDISRKDLFICVQNNDVKTLKDILDSCPSSMNMVDDYGWSLLMIACQANSVDAVKELLARGVDTSVRDKGGNSATNLVTRSKNLELADLLINHTKNSSSNNNYETRKKIKSNRVNSKIKERFACEICNSVVPDKDEHVASTVHNINASKDKKIPTNYVIPQTNRGYQIMLKVGWDRETGLGRDGSGNKYPIKAIPKKDRKGLGHKRKEELSKEVLKNIKSSKLVITESKNERRMEVNFRREFY